MIRPIADRMLWIVANYVNTTPNRLTLISIFVSLASAWSFYNARPVYLIIGALLFELAYAIDCIDGGLARLKGMTSKLGAYLDHMSAYWGIFFVIMGLAFGQFSLTGDATYLLLGFAYLFMHLLSWLEYFTLQKSGLIVGDDSLLTPVIPSDSLIGRVRKWLVSKNFVIGVTVTDVDALVLFLFPVINQVELGLLVGFFLILAQSVVGFLLLMRR